MKNTKVIFIILFFSILSFSLGSIFTNSLANKSNISQNSVQQKVKGSNTKIQCTEDLRLIDAAKKLNNNQVAVNLLKNNCMWLFGALEGELEGNGTKDLVFWGSGAGCVSCHGQTIYVVSGKKVIFKQEETDPEISVKKLETSAQGLVITRPLYQRGDTYADHTWGLTTTYVWFDNGFVVDDERPYKY